MFMRLAAVAALAVTLSACQTTQQAAERVQGKWIGQPVDAFFVENGPPVSSYALADGGLIYTWRGGEASFVRPAQVRTTPLAPSQPLMSRSRTTTTTSAPEPGTTVTRTTTTSASFGFTPPAVTTVVRPAERVNLVCEAQITADAEGVIRAVRISRDTQGAFLSLSRCADIFQE
ncbi:hypothetical protein [Salinarimonas sp.]|uniref:hypothetical protein n=1 Tax=Salinarimonas sp. TaxID=2766526 RepID=UPI0032D8B8FF